MVHRGCFLARLCRTCLKEECLERAASLFSVWEAVQHGWGSGLLPPYHPCSPGGTWLILPNRWILTKTNARLHWGGAVLDVWTDWKRKGWRAAVERDLRCWSMASWTWETGETPMSWGGQSQHGQPGERGDCPNVLGQFWVPQPNKDLKLWQNIWIMGTKVVKGTRSAWGHWGFSAGAEDTELRPPWGLQLLQGADNWIILFKKNKNQCFKLFFLEEKMNWTTEIKNYF